MTHSFSSLVATGAIALSLVACSTEADGDATTGDNSAASDEVSGDMTPSSVDVVEAASANGNLDRFLEVAVSNGVGETLANADAVTIFAPIDEAFGAVEGLDQMSQEQVVAILQRHAVGRIIRAEDIAEGETQLQTLSGETLTINNQGGQIMVTSPDGVEARVVEADITGDNGVVHAINTVLTE
ncbi:hypothetical protein GRI38_02530 [Altererythrobacter aurantiacus]|uniref:FAS1 domain-containing protein n=1 Tax=Parapontixanthobacter aurantiacus TaxID=1463599 RepID=A0A844ZDA3_9SPHN|nr:fasciclin domain-containing protein [Parapontixanthobacter aurantiacus]MXO84910.1 hypothetical protein [Parapontixanthobacter aurantiacus]